MKIEQNFELISNYTCFRVNAKQYAISHHCQTYTDITSMLDFRVGVDQPNTYCGRGMGVIKILHAPPKCLKCPFVFKTFIILFLHTRTSTCNKIYGNKYHMLGITIYSTLQCELFYEENALKTAPTRPMFYLYIYLVYYKEQQELLVAQI